MGNFGKDQSKFKLVVYMKNDDRMVFYSLENEEKRSAEVAIRGMIRRLLLRKYLNKYKTAIIYDNTTGAMVSKYVNGVKEL